MSFRGRVKHESDFSALFWSKDGLEWHVPFSYGTLITKLFGVTPNKSWWRSFFMSSTALKVATSTDLISVMLFEPEYIV